MYKGLYISIDIDGLYKPNKEGMRNLGGNILACKFKKIHLIELSIME